MIRLIISDIDGTLVPEGGTQINPEYIDVIRKLTDLGVQFTAASGRQTSGVHAVFHELRDLIYYMGDNGACIEKAGEPVRELRMNADALKALLEETGEIPGCLRILSVREGCFTPEQDEEFLDLVYGQYKQAGSQVDDMTPYLDRGLKLSLYSREGSEKLRERLYERWKAYFSIHISGERWLDFNAFEATKGDAVTFLQKKLGVTPAETMVFGDNFNDISMLKCAERSYASELSHPDVKQAAKYEVASYERDGVLQVLKQLLEEMQHER